MTALYVIGLFLLGLAVGFVFCAMLTSADATSARDDAGRVNFLERNGLQVGCMDGKWAVLEGIPQHTIGNKSFPTFRKAVDFAMVEFHRLEPRDASELMP